MRRPGPAPSLPAASGPTAPVANRHGVAWEEVWPNEVWCMQYPPLPSPLLPPDPKEMMMCGYPNIKDETGPHIGAGGEDPWLPSDVIKLGACQPGKLGKPSSVGTDREMSIGSFDMQAPSTAGSTLSPVQTVRCGSWTTNNSSYSRCNTPLLVRNASRQPELDRARSFVCLGPRCGASFPSAEELDAHVKASHTHTCWWVGCDSQSFDSHSDLVWHVNAEHLLICPVSTCRGGSFESTRSLKIHLAVAHPETSEDKIQEWQLLAAQKRLKRTLPATVDAAEDPASGKKVEKEADPFRPVETRVLKELLTVALAKRRCQDRLRSVVEKKARRNAPTPKSAESPTDLLRTRASRIIENASFPMVFEHAILPFLAEFLPKWADMRHVISVSKGKTPQSRRICIMTRNKISRTRKIIIAVHVGDLLPDKFRGAVSFVFSTGEVSRMVWARGLSRQHMDEICSARNPFHFRRPCMGDSIGLRGDGAFDDSTSTLGPCILVGGASFWLGNFHPFLEAYKTLESVHVEHPSPEDRSNCLGMNHDAMSQDDNFRIGRLAVTSGINLKTTRVSHDPYWEDNDADPPLVVTDWALITAHSARPNMLRRFPSEIQPPAKEPLISSTSGITPGCCVISSGRTSGYQRGQVCEIPAYVSGSENGTQKATREWFVEEPDASDDEDSWIRGGIGVHGDSGGAIIDAETNCLVGQLWGRNRYWGAGPRHTFFTPIADIFDDVQEKSGLASRPQLPQHGGDEADRYPVVPSCQKCYDQRTYLDSRRSSRVSLSMYMGKGDGDQDLTSVEAFSELDTPLAPERSRSQGVEEIGASFNSVLSPVPMHSLFPGPPMSPYPTSLSIDHLYDQHTDFPPGPQSSMGPSSPAMKRAGSSSGLPLFVSDLDGQPNKRQKVRR